MPVKQPEERSFGSFEEALKAIDQSAEEIWRVGNAFLDVIARIFAMAEEDEVHGTSEGEGYSGLAFQETGCEVEIVQNLNERSSPTLALGTANLIGTIQASDTRWVDGYFDDETEQRWLRTTNGTWIAYLPNSVSFVVEGCLETLPEIDFDIESVLEMSSSLQYLQTIGLSGNVNLDDVDPEELAELANFFSEYPNSLMFVDLTFEELQEVRRILEDLQAYHVTIGVRLEGPDYSGSGINVVQAYWSLEKLYLVYESVQQIAESLGPRFEGRRQVGYINLPLLEGDPYEAFIAMFGEIDIKLVRMTRTQIVDGEEQTVVFYCVNELFASTRNQPGCWFGRSFSSGRRIILNELAFSDDREGRFQAIDLIAHEITHRINYRSADRGDILYRCLRSASVASLYEGTPDVIRNEASGELEPANGRPGAFPLDYNQGYIPGHQPRSGDNLYDYEIVTDAIMSWSFGYFTDDEYGRFRNRQVIAVLDYIINCLAVNA